MPPWQFIEAVQGVNAGNALVATSTLTRDATGDAWTKGARSNQSIAGDGFVEFVAPATGAYRAMGLSVVGAASVNFNTIDRGFYLKGGGTPTEFAVIEDGFERVTGVYAAGDVLRVQRVAGGFTYYRNGELVWTSVAAAINVPVMVDSAFFVANSAITNVRLYDASIAAWTALTWSVTGVVASIGAAHSTRRMTFAAPTKMRAGDQLVAVIGSQAQEFISATSVPWDFNNSFVSATKKRGVAVYRRIVTGDEPTSYTIDLNVRQEALGATLVYRGLDNGADWVGGSGIDTAGTVHPCPSRTLTRYSDLYMGAIVQVAGAGGMSAPTDSSVRAHFIESPLGVFNVRLFVFDFAAEAVGPTDTKRASDAAATSSSAFSFALQGMPALGQGLNWSPIVPGAIGLPMEGI